MKAELICVVCGCGFSVYGARSKTAKYCSNECKSKGAVKAPSVRCSICGHAFHRKKSQLEKSKTGSYCSYKCLNKAKETLYIGDKNPNYKKSGIGSDGYRTYVPAAPSSVVDRKLHRAVVRMQLGLDVLPSGFHVHHRDCDVLNNDPENLVALTASDHKWIHQQYGNATLWAMHRGKVSVSDMVSWSDDPQRASRLLTLSCVSQGFMMSELGMSFEAVLMMDGPVYDIEFVEV